VFAFWLVDGDMSQPGRRHPDHVMQAEAQAALRQMTNGYWVTQIIYVAARLGIADLLDDGPQAIDVLAESTGTHEPSLRRLMRALTGLGVFRQAENGEYENTALGRCLVTGSPGSLRAITILSGEELYQGWGRLLESVRTGQTAFDRVFGQPLFEYLAANAEAAAVFNEAMASTTRAAARAVSAAYDFSWAKILVDVGGGTGAFLGTILEANPQARGIVFDRQDVAAAAGALLAGSGVADRCEAAEGNFFDAVPSGADAYILSWIIHDWDDDRSITILKNCRRAVARDGRVLVIELVIPPGNEASLGKLYDIHMLAMTGGRERREDEYRELLAAADLRLTRVIPTSDPRSIIEAVPM
jgi:O-methyltransferase/methyltransferase family protein